MEKLLNFNSLGLLRYLRAVPAPDQLPPELAAQPSVQGWPLTPGELDTMLRHHYARRRDALGVESGTPMVVLLDQELTAALQQANPALYRRSKPTPSIRTYPQVHRLVIARILAFIECQGLGSAHYFGQADEGLITALRKRPGFTLGVSDYYDRWHSSLAFWGVSEGNPSIDWSQYPIPESLKDVPFHQEGMIETRFVIYDLPSNAFLSLKETANGNRPRVEFIALLGGAMQHSHALADFFWVTKNGVKFGSRT
jgi:hypothetical protein